MKPKSVKRTRLKRGFALVTTLLMMILLTIVALGTLSLSAVTLRTSSQSGAHALAQANARMALMIAIGELQKYAGPDRAVTCTSEILAAPSTPVPKPNTTGVWESWWDFDPNTAPDYTAEKTNRFRRWLVSDANLNAPHSPDFVNTAWTGNTIELVGSGSLGDSATAADKVTAGLVPISKDGKIEGSYAWHVSDESVKARINLYRDPDQNTTLADKRALLAGHRPNPSFITGPDGSSLDFLPTDQTPVEFADAEAHVGKLIDLNQFELLDQALGKVKPLRNDITPYSLGVLADVRGGGLKQDLSSVFEAAATGSLPAEFDGKTLYASTHGITGVSDPHWSALAGYYNSFRTLTTPENNPTRAVTVDATATAPVPTQYNPAPVIAKVDTIFSLVGRPIKDVNWMYGGGVAPSAGYNYDFFVNLIFTPMVTLHNPYNVNLSFHSMNVEFLNIPVAFNFMYQSGTGGPFVSRGVVPGTFESLNNMTYNNKRGNKKFVMKIADWSNAKPVQDASGDTFAINGPIVMKPGQTLVFSPYYSAKSTTSAQAASFYEDSKNVTGQNTIAFDWNSHSTGSIKAKPIFVPGVGFETCLITPAAWSTVGMSWNNHLLLRDGLSPYNTGHVTDRFYVEFKIQQPSWYPFWKPGTPNKSNTLAPPSFEVSAEIQADASSVPVKYASLKFDYGNDTTIKNLFNDRVYRYPPGPNDSLTGVDVAAPNRQPYATQAPYVHPLAIFSAYARTTSGGVYETGKRELSANSGNSSQINILKDGRLAGKPFLFHNVSRSNFTMALATEKPGGHAYELNFQPFLSKGDYEDYMDVDVNRVPSLTGNKTTSGIKSGSYFDLPSGPLQTIADFRRSNALSTTYQPHFVQPVGNSLLHPLMSPDKVVETNPSISPTALLDHSVLANHALYDRFYFSTFSTRGATEPETVFEQFISGTAPLASQAFEPYLPIGKTAAIAKAELFTSGAPNGDTYNTAAEYQMIRGPFNVNSTSVQAWKAMLASMSKTDIATLWAKSAALESVTTNGALITPMSLVNGGVIDGVVDPTKIDNQKSNTWNGFRELDETELEKLAVEIVAEVRERGPFLSMSEFVNRRVGPSSPLTLSGALEAAITRAEINEEQNADFPDSFLDQVPITAADISDANLYSYTTPEATTGNPAAGAPGWVNQGDLLRILEPSATVRGDTFVIRTYGEALDAKGNVIAQAYLEAVVQRFPEYVDSADRPSLNVYSDPTASPANKAFGRRMNIVSFRWLTENEI